MTDVPMTFNIVCKEERWDREADDMVRTAFMIKDAMAGRCRFQATAYGYELIDDRKAGFFPSLRFQPDWMYFRPKDDKVVCWTDRFFAQISGDSGEARMDLEIHVWAETYALAQSVRDWFMDQARSFKVSVTETAFSLKWRFIGMNGDIRCDCQTEEVADLLLDEAYPALGGVEEFIRDYLDAPEPVLVLQGPPGTGKTRLIRKLLSQISVRKEEKAEVLYTGDPQVLERDAVFIEFVTGANDAFLVEDADAFLQPRSEGNEMLHRFLNITDGIVRAKGRKVIFSTNLPGTKDIDSALLRPGRCFEHVYLPELDRNEALHLARKLSASPQEAERTGKILESLSKGSYSVAEVYSAHNRATAPACERRTGRRSLVPRRAVGFVS